MSVAKSQMLLSFRFPGLANWFTKFAPANRMLNQNHRRLGRMRFPALGAVTCICFEFSLVQCLRLFLTAVSLFGTIACNVFAYDKQISQ